MAENLGTILKNAREARNLNIAQASKATRIRAFYIEAMEANHFDDLPSPVHARGFIRNYAEFLGLDFSDLVASIDIALKSVTISSQINSIKTNLQEISGDLINNEIEIDQIPFSPVLEHPGENTPFQSNQIAEAQSTTLTLEYQDPGSLFQSGSQLIFASIGIKLKKQREVLGLSLDEVELHSHVRKHYLESIESGDFEKLPSSVQARGMLTNYANFLEIDQEEILYQYADGLQAQRNEKQPATNGARSSPIPWIRFSAFRRFISIDLVFGSGLIILLIAFAFWATGNVINQYNSPSTLVTARSISDIILTPLQTMSQADVAQTQATLEFINPPTSDVTANSTIPESVTGQVQVYVIILQSSWMRVTIDGIVVFEGRVFPGSAFPYNGNNQVEILTGNGSGIQIIYNQTDLGVMGMFGEVVNRIYTLNSILEPTASITPLPTMTLTPTITPRLSKTPVPTRTPFSSSNP